MIFYHFSVHTSLPHFLKRTRRRDIGLPGYIAFAWGAGVNDICLAWLFIISAPMRQSRLWWWPHISPISTPSPRRKTASSLDIFRAVALARGYLKLLYEYFHSSFHACAKAAMRRMLAAALSESSALLADYWAVKFPAYHDTIMPCLMSWSTIFDDVDIIRYRPNWNYTEHFS